MTNGSYGRRGLTLKVANGSYGRGGLTLKVANGSYRRGGLTLKVALLLTDLVRQALKKKVYNNFDCVCYNHSNAKYIYVRVHVLI